MWDRIIAELLLTMEQIRKQSTMVDQREGNPYLGTCGLRWVCNVCVWSVRELGGYEKENSNKNETHLKGPDEK